MSKVENTVESGVLRIVGRFVAGINDGIFDLGSEIVIGLKVGQFETLKEGGAVLPPLFPTSVGSRLGTHVGSTVGSMLGQHEGDLVGPLGDLDGSNVGPVSLSVGIELGIKVERTLGFTRGIELGCFVFDGLNEFSILGNTEGSPVGLLVGSSVGSNVGIFVGSNVGLTLGNLVGALDGPLGALVGN
jgi:hypothetical protein